MNLNQVRNYNPWRLSWKICKEPKNQHWCKKKLCWKRKFSILNLKLKALNKRTTHNSEKWRIETNNVSSNLELLMKDKEKILRTITFVKRKEPKRNMTKWLNNMNKNTDKKFKTFKRNLKPSNQRLCLLKRIWETQLVSLNIWLILVIVKSKILKIF